MKQRLLAVGLSLVLVGATVPAPLRANDELEHKTKHVLLISIDGMHAVDYANCVAAKTCPNLAALGTTGVNYTHTTTSKPSDSFPGLMSIVTGGSPRTFGAFYDVAYDRVLAPPLHITGNGLPGTADDASLAPCVPNQIYRNPDGSTGTQTEYEEGNEFDQSQINGRPAPGKNALDFIDGNTTSIDPDRLIRDPFNGCKPVYSWNFIRTNTIFGVIHAAHGYTAWSDKHAGYASVSGPNPLNDPHPEIPANIDDYYSPEVNSLHVQIPGLKTAGLTPQAVVDCGALTPNGDDWTTDFDAIKCNDQLKVNAVLNQIHSKNHLGTSAAPVPVIFGMNFQAVSVGEKLIEPKLKTEDAPRTDANAGGYEDAAGTPRPKMLGEIQYVDAAIGSMVAALKAEGLLDSTAIIITAKHGQSPIDPSLFFAIPGHANDHGTPPSGIIGNLLPFTYSDPNNGLGLAEDDISQIWLADAKTTRDAVNALEGAASTIGLGQIYFGESLNDLFNRPGLPKVPGPCCALREGGDPRTPNIVVIPKVGVVYTGSLKKQAEHGGFSHDDTNAMILVSNPRLSAHTVDSFVQTAQVAPTILKLLGLDPQALDAVRLEGTPVLPSLFGGENNQE